jgi:prepilin-type N-terminal cleavage/methylation domain-containing protein
MMIKPCTRPATSSRVPISSPWRPLASLRLHSDAAFTLVELLVSMSIIGLVAGSSVWAMLDSNRFAAIDRIRTAAKAACQEKIDQALTVPYSSEALPALFTTGSPASIPPPNGNPDRGTQTIPSETVSLYVDQDDLKPPAPQGTRTTRVSLSDATLGLVRVWVRVDYNFRGKAYSYEMYAVRALD